MNEENRRALGWLKGTASIAGDIVAPVGEEWDAERVLDRAMVAEAAERMGLRMVVLFGSHAGGDLSASPESDVDLAVLPGPVRPSIMDVHAALATATSASLDLVWLDEADHLFRWEILRNSELLYGDIDDYLEYRAFAFRDFTDSADLRALEAELLTRKLARLKELERAD